MDQRRAAAALFALAACFACATAAPTASNQTALDLFEAPVEGCYYNFQHYGESDRIMTNEPCLNCTCHNRMLMCYLRVCPFTKPIGQDCTVEKRADQCCPIVTCPDVPVDLLTSTSTSSPAEYGATGLGKMDKYGCSINGKYFPEGSKVPPTPNKPCEHCYCIHNMTTCVMQECTLHVDGCTPIYHKDVCCPIRYSCDHAEDEIPLLDDMTTTVRPTPGFLLTTTTMMPFTQVSQDCVHDDKIFSDGALIKTEKACEHCYCMKGDIVCVVQECGTPMENEGKNCTSLPPKQGQCCPDTYICEGDELSTAQFNDESTTLTPPRRFGVEGSGYRNEPDESYTETSSIGDTEIEGSGEDFLTTIPGLHSDTSPVTSHNVYPYSTEINAVSSEVTTQRDIVDENKVLTTESSLITSTNTNDSKGDTDEEKGLNVMTTVAPSDQPMYTTSVEDNLKQKQDTTLNDISTTKTLDQYTTLEPNVTPKLNEILTEITTKQSLLDDVDNMTPIDEEFIIATKLPEKTDNIENSFEENLTTFKPMQSEESITEQGSSETTPKEITFTEQPTYSSVTTSSQETTTINVQENEILEETLPARIPGEGDCLLGGVTFKNNTSVPSTNKCHISCKCVSSIIKCDPIICTPPLEYMENMNDCQPIYDSPDSCCPTYVCNTKETIAPESHSQMSGTESPKPTECVGDVCQNTEPSVLPQNDINNCTNGNCDSKKEEIPVSETQPCDETTGCQVPVIKPCEGENCITNPVVQTDTQDNFETNNKPCNNENECQVPVITPCIGDDCITGSKFPNNKETDVLDKETKDEENICLDENCRRKEYDETKANIPCSGTDCKQQDTVSPSVVNDVSSPEPGPPISTTKPNQAKQPEDVTLSEPQSTLEPFVETTVPSITTSSEIKQTVEIIREESTTQTYLVDDSLISHQPDRHSEVDKPSTEPSVSDIERITSSIFDLSTVKEHLLIATEPATTEYSSKTSDETIMQYTTLGASLDDINTESTTGMPDKTEIRTETVSKENTKDTDNMLTDYPKVESTTADTRVSSESDKERNQNELIHVTGRPNVDEKTTYGEILEENMATSVPQLPSSIAYDESSSDTTESEILFTKEIPDKNISVQPISDVTGAPDIISGHRTTEQRENYPSTLTPETFTKNVYEPTNPEIYALSTEESKKEEHDSVSPDVPTVTEAEVLEVATEIFNKEGTTFQPESHKQSEPEVTSPSAIEENQTQKAIDKDIPELFTEVSFGTTTEFNQKDQSEIEQDFTSIDKQKAQTIIPEIKYTEVTQDFTTKLPQNPTEDKISDIRKDIEQNTETFTAIAPLIINEETTTYAEANESPSEKPVVNKETTTLRINEPSDFTTSKRIETTYTEFEKTTEYLSGDKINTTPIYNDISEETTISLPNISESVSEMVTDVATENNHIKDTHTVTEPSNELDKTGNEQITESSNESDKTIPEQSTGLPDELDKTVTEKSTGLPNESDNTGTEPSNELDKTGSEQSTTSPIESDKTVTEQSTGSPNESDKTEKEQSTESDKTGAEQSTEPSNESQKTVAEQSTGSPNESDETDEDQSTELDKHVTEPSTESSNESDKTGSEQASGSPNESDKTDKEQSTESDKTGAEQSTEPSNESQKTVAEQSTGSPNESDETVTEQSTGSPNESDKTDEEQSTELDKHVTEPSTEPSNESDKTGSKQVTGSPNESDKTDKEQSTESDKTVTEQSTASSESEHTGSEPTTESSNEFDKAGNEQSTDSPNIFDKTLTEQSTKSSNELVDSEIVQPTESPNESKPEIFITDKIEEDEVTISNTDKPNTTLLDEPVDTMTHHQSTESSVNDELGQTHVLEIEKLAVTTQTNIIPEVPEKETTFNPESELSSTTSPMAVELEQETKASTDSSESQENQTLYPMSLITEKPHTVTVTDNLQTIAVTETKESEPITGVELTTIGKDLLTTKQNADTVTPSIESTSRILDSDVTTESPKEEPTSKASQSLDESILGSITEQPGTEIEMTSTPITQNQNESKQELPDIEDESSLISTTLSDILMEKAQSTDHQGDVSTKPSVLSETHDATDYPIFIEEKTKQPELFTTDLITDRITEEPLSISHDVQGITMSSEDEHRVSNSQDGISTTVVVENESEKFTKAPELPIITSDADTIQQEIDSTKHREPEASTETSYETHTKSTTIKEEIYIPTQPDILSQDKTDKTLTTQSLPTVTPEQFATNSPIENTKLDSISSTLTDTTGISTERALADKIDLQEATTESKYEYSETTPYFVELEEHTHQIMQETSIMPIDESSTEKASGIESTERGDQSLFDNLGNGLQTEKSTDVTVTPHGYSQETTLSSSDIYTTTASEVSSSLEPQKDTEIREQDKLEPTDEGIETTLSPIQTPSLIQNEEKVTSIPLETKKPTIPELEITSTTEKSHTVMNEEAQKPDVLLETKIPDEYTKTTTPHYVHEEITSVKTTLFDEKLIETSSTTSKPITTKPDDQPTDEIPSAEFPPSGDSGYGQEPDYGEEEQAVIPGICRYGGKVYGSTQQIPRDDPCDFCFCFRSDIICLQQSCPPPIHGCREEPIQGFCCPRYECPVSMATTLNVTTTTTTTTTTLPPHFLPHAYKGAAQRRGCHIKGHTYKVGEVVRASSGPCLHCTCGGDGQMKCDPKACTPEPMLRQMIAAAVSARRR